MNTKVVFSATIAGFGSIELRPFDMEKDIPILHHWVNQEYAQYWGMLGKSLEEVRAEYQKIITHSDVFTGTINGTVSFLLERYNPQQDLIGNYYTVKKYDCGIHVIVAPAEQPVHQFTWHIFSTILKFVFSDFTVQRIVVEPDIRNKKMFAICHRVGFEDGAIVSLPHKTAKLAFCTREQFIQKINHYILSNTTMNLENQIQHPHQAIAHIQPEVWEKANRLLVRKALCEFSHELLVQPKKENQDGKWSHYSLLSNDQSAEYRFKAQLLALNHWHIEPLSITKTKNNAVLPLDAVLFITEFQESLGISKEILPSYIEEITSTLYGSAYKLLKASPTAKELATADFQTIEQAMTEGHPGFVANNGRIGFNTMDYVAYTPETGNPFRILWLAGHRDRTVYAGTEALPYDTLIRQELDQDTIALFNTVLLERGLSPNDYYFIPVHPWQWFNKLANLFSPELASSKLVCLGYGPDLYQAQQSIRTLFNTSNPGKHYTKTSVSILNMGFMRGLPVYYLGSAPQMAEWLENLLSKDTYLTKTGFAMLGEVASVSYINPYFEAFGKHNPYNKMLASLWRESPVPFLNQNERLMTMASLLHVDTQGNALLPEIIKAAGLNTYDWLQEYFRTYLSPLLHCFFQYDLVFMPHGENIILGFENNIPVRSFMKDITEEAVILNPDIALPENLSRMYAEVPEEVKLLSVFIDIFDGFFRFMSAILVEHAAYNEEDFWQGVADCIHEYQEEHPHLESKFERYDLFTAEFQLSCLNRLQLNNNKTMIDLDDPVALLQFQGKLQNPIASFKKITV
ncbi:GNAT family N-acetyltransferase [Flavobacterium humi]|uniref:GNAT family N-acetyltransferase n=1 Tax=Flavobacterium humi TaxID=2562683 RepID=A0A4Z0L627_9FLAO|nr:GNAT family N-acetyltransferase [Flavobacterium humi]TGD57021.1 GNAT family N-acetyltransferase [Flavobacterium humi]